MTGLTAFLKENYYPNYVFKFGNSNYNNSSGASSSRKRGGDPYARGRDVDLEIRRWIENGTPVTHPYAEKFIAFLRTKNLTPEAAQVHVNKSRLETYIDAVVLDEKKRRFVVEVKTGFHGYHEAASDRMRKDFAFLSNCPRNQHVLQAAFSEQMYRYTHVGKSVAGSFVLRINDAGVQVVRTPAKINAVATKVLSQLQ